MVVHHTPLCLTNDEFLVVVPPILIGRHLHPQLYLDKCIESGVWCLCTTIHSLCPIYNLVWYCTIQPVLSYMVVYHANMIALAALVNNRVSSGRHGVPRQYITINLENILMHDIFGRKI